MTEHDMIRERERERVSGRLGLTCCRLKGCLPGVPPIEVIRFLRDGVIPQSDLHVTTPGFTLPFLSD